MTGRRFVALATWNALAAAFNNPGNPVFVEQRVDDVFIDITARYRFCGYEILLNYNVFDAFKNPRNDESPDLPP